MTIKECLKRNSYLRHKIEKIGMKRRKASVQKNGVSEIQKITSELNKNDIMAFADFGTLLGLIREGKLLNGDGDIDIGIVVNDNNTLRKADLIMEEMGYKLLREFTINNDITEQSYLKNHIKIDFQIYFLVDKDDMFCYLFYNPSGDAREKQWKSVIKKCPRVKAVKEITIQDHKIFVPTNAEEIISYKYGANWRIPDKSWVYWEGPNTYPTDDMGYLRSVDNGGIKE